MKLMIASDLHGSNYYVKKLMERFREEAPVKILLLGDLLYHGPRNALPQDYSCPDVAEQLNAIKEKIVAVRGNCDCEVDQMVLDFPIMSDYALLEVNGLSLFATHGHLWNEQFPPKMTDGTILLNGHLHIPACTPPGTYTYINPGSTSIPKGGSVGSYVVLEDKTFIWKDMDGNSYKSYTAE